MAISEDTAALVAAQLTQAWATRLGSNDDTAGAPMGSRVLRAYAGFLTAVRDGGVPGRVDPESIE